GDRRADAVDAIDIGLLHPLQELAGVSGQRLDVARLPRGVDRVKGERRFSRAADPGEHDELPAGQRQVDVLEIVRSSTANDERGYSGGRRHIKSKALGAVINRACNPRYYSSVRQTFNARPELVRGRTLTNTCGIPGRSAADLSVR